MNNNQSVVKVSVFMLAYNHEKYIEQAIESILNQKVDFQYEVVIGEDCSKDRTREICIDYQKKYPDVIRLILHEENVGIYENVRSVYDACKGVYVAHLEGDDYWNDRHKLQKQVEFLDRHPEYSACVHNSYMLNYINGKKRKLSSHKKDYDISMEELIQWHNVFQTSSLVFRGYLSKNKPEFAQGISGIGDYPTALWLGLNGKIHYMNDVLSTYRFNVPGSWSSSNITQEQIKHNEDRVIKMLLIFNDYTQKKYQEAVNKRIDRMTIGRYSRENDIKTLREIGVKKIISVCGMKGLMGIILHNVLVGLNMHN